MKKDLTKKINELEELSCVEAYLRTCNMDTLEEYSLPAFYKSLYATGSWKDILIENKTIICNNSEKPKR